MEEKKRLASCLSTLLLALSMTPLTASANIFEPPDLVTYDAHAVFAPPVGGYFSDVHVPDQPVIDPGADYGFLYPQPISLFPGSGAPNVIATVDPQVYVEVDLAPSAGAGDFLTWLTVAETPGEITTVEQVQVPDPPIPGGTVPAECQPGQSWTGFSCFPSPAGGPALPSYCPVGVLIPGELCQLPDTCPDLGTAPDCFHNVPTNVTVSVPAASLVDFDLLISDLDWGIPGYIVDVVAGVNELGCAGFFGNTPDGSSVALDDCSGAGAAHFEVFAEHAPVPGVLALMGIGLAGLGFSRRRRATA